MSESSRRIALSAAAAAVVLALAGPPARAKVVFTGYGDLRATAESRIDLELPVSGFAAPGISNGRFYSRGTAFDALGLFATSSLTDQAQFQMDVSYRDVGYATRTVRIQYAYVDWTAAPGTTVQAGKVALPFGYYNQHHFYPFQRAGITAPTFQSSILGLPITDLGFVASHATDVGPLAARIAAYAVNGYGPVPGSRTAFRNASLPGGLTIANNLGSTNPNRNIAGGGQVAVGPAALPGSEVGGSYYAGNWDPDARHLFQMSNAHLRAVAGPVEVLYEFLHLNAHEDAGMVANFGVKDWRTNGSFLIVKVTALEVAGRPVTPWVRGEDYRTRGAGGTGEEKLQSLAGGVAWRAADSVTLKAEGNRLIYALPYRSGGTLGIGASTFTLGLVVTF